jgi:hypothetical protein
LLEPRKKSRDARRRFPIGLGDIHEVADAPHAVGLLRPRCERPCRRCSAEQRDELATPHLSTRGLHPE